MPVVSSSARTGCDPRGSYSMDIHLAHCLCQGIRDLPPDTGIACADGAVFQVRKWINREEIGYGRILFGKVTGSRNYGSIGGKSRYSCSVCFCCTYFSSHASGPEAKRALDGLLLYLRAYFLVL